MLPKIFEATSSNTTKKEKISLMKLKAHNLITIKPADKNLGSVIMNTQDYIDQCLVHLNSKTYILVANFPVNLKTALENTLFQFKQDLTHNIIHGKSLYNHLLPPNNCNTPQFYGLPKIHKEFTSVPPIRPIVSHYNSLLSITAKISPYSLLQSPILTTFITPRIC